MLGLVDGTGALVPLEGGWSGRTFVASGPEGEHVIRIHDPDDTSLEVTASLLRLVRGLLPVPEVLEVRRGDPSTDRPGLLVTERLPGERGDLVLPHLAPAEQAAVGEQVGRLVAVLGGIPMLRAGRFVGADLTIEPWSGAQADLVDFVEDHLDRLSHWTGEERMGLLDVADEAEELLETEQRVVLVHSDLNPKNLLVDPATREVTGLVDWEFAHAGHPFTDLGNVLRLDRAPSYVAGVLGAYERLRGVPAERALVLARAADLWALVDLAARRGQNPVADRADALLRGIARHRDPSWVAA